MSPRLAPLDPLDRGRRDLELLRDSLARHAVAEQDFDLDNLGLGQFGRG